MGPIYLPRQDVSDIARGNALGPGTAIDHACALPIAPARVNASANGSVDLDLQHLFNQFPSEDTLTTIVDPSDPLVEGSPVVLIDIDPTLAREAFPSESMLLVIPAGPVVVYPSAVERSWRDTAARWHDAVRRRSTVIVLGTIAFGQMLGWTAWLTIRVARGLWSSAWQGVVALRSVIGELVIRIAGLIQSRGRLAIHWRRRLGSPATALISHFGRTLGWGARLLIQSARAASLAIRRRAHDLQPGRFLSRQLRSTQQWIAIQINRTLRLAGQRLNAISRSVRAMRRTQVTRITRVLNATSQRYRWTHASRAACHRSLSGLRQALVSTAPRFGVLTVIITSVIATGIFAWTQWRAPLGAAPLAVASLGIVPLAVAPIESRSLAFETPPRRAAVTTPQIDSPASTGRRVDAEPIRSIQRLLNRYRDAYSTLDVAAVHAIWPSVDTKALRSAFDRLAEYNLDYNACQISLGDARADAVCGGIAQSRRVGDRTRRTTDHQWQFVVNRIENRWLIASVVAR